MTKPTINIFWFRRDLRLHDNPGLYHALNSGIPVLPVFVFDKNILDELEDKNDRRVNFIYEQLRSMQTAFLQRKSSFYFHHGAPLEIFSALESQYDIKAVYTNNDYEPYAVKRDEQVRKLLSDHGILFHSYKDHVLYEPHEVLKDDGKPYTVFTPYARKWHSKSVVPATYESEKLLDKLYKGENAMPSLESLGFSRNSSSVSPPDLDSIRNYHTTRDFPAYPTTRLSVHLRFGTISIREVFKAGKSNQTFLNEIIWREFYQMIIHHFPHVVHQSFKPEFDKIKWRNDPKDFQRWCDGNTGYPFVDAGMRELNATGFMHNRLRMVTASFLTKHLLVDWRWGEAYFARKLLDYELASNNGGWQWAAGSGCDAAPYFRIFNPALQAKKFDPDHIYTSRWVHEWKDPQYPSPMIEHKEARDRCLAVYSDALKK